MSTPWKILEIRDLASELKVEAHQKLMGNSDPEQINDLTFLMESMERIREKAHLIYSVLYLKS
jgi:hypothetical protein